MLKLVVWIAASAIGLAVVVTQVTDRIFERAPPSAPVATELVAAEPVTPIYDRFGEIAVDRSPDGHFYVEGQANGAPVRFMIDTGASQIVLRREDAQAAGIVVRSDGFTATGRTAGGDVPLQPITIDRLTVGGNEARELPAMVVAGALPVSLLGHSWLKRTGQLTIDGDRMTLE